MIMGVGILQGHQLAIPIAGVKEISPGSQLGINHRATQPWMCFGCIRVPWHQELHWSTSGKKPFRVEGW